MPTEQITIQSNQSVLFHFSPNAQKVIFALALVLCLVPFISPAIALVMGIAVAQLSGHPFLHLNHKATQVLLQVSVVGLGFGMNIHTALETGKSGILLTVVFISGTLLIGYFLSSILKIENKTAFLISAGTAICGGSAIAAISPVIKAGEKQISVALGCVFILNSIALFVFPVVGQYFHLSQTQFGLWCAIAIHDTSSVVGAASKYGPHALEIATTVKLTRALWIIPVSIFSGFMFKTQSKKVAVPYFIGLFILAMLFNTYVPVLKIFSTMAVMIAKTGLVLTLFLIGGGISSTVVKTVGVKPFLMSIVLWIIVSVLGLLTVMTLLK